MLTNRGPWLLVATGSLSLLLPGACSLTSSPRDQNWGSAIGRGDGSTPAPQADAGADADVGADVPAQTSPLDATSDTMTETMDDGAIDAQDTVDLGAVDGETQ